MASLGLREFTLGVAIQDVEGITCRLLTYGHNP